MEPATITVSQPHHFKKGDMVTLNGESFVVSEVNSPTQMRIRTGTLWDRIVWAWKGFCLNVSLKWERVLYKYYELRDRFFE